MKKGDVVYFKRKKYYVVSVMDCEDANWICAISKHVDDYYTEWKTIFKTMVDDLTFTIENEQLSLFEGAMI